VARIQVVDAVEVLRRASAGQPLEDLAIALHHRAQTLAKRLVLALAGDGSAMASRTASETLMTSARATASGWMEGAGKGR
jgi:hypothetical protein